MNIWDISILAAVALMAGLAIWRMRKKKKTRGCCCGCAGCPGSCSNEKGAADRKAAMKQ